MECFVSIRNASLKGDTNATELITQWLEYRHFRGLEFDESSSTFRKTITFNRYFIFYSVLQTVVSLIGGTGAALTALVYYRKR